ncbi:hypothetical protein BDW74DRAFT_60155 [Aspergillus multicolor]|uniref:uncharacterized protein n=1 Tax=Aspergillus multicolor TaxID=41759 RepID=UPI003CCCA696
MNTMNSIMIFCCCFSLLGSVLCQIHLYILFFLCSLASWHMAFGCIRIIMYGAICCYDYASLLFFSHIQSLSLVFFPLCQGPVASL